MPRRRPKRIDPPQVEAPRDDVAVSRAALQVLHNAARSVYRQAIQVDNHHVDSLNFLTLLNAAIDEGHQALGTERPAADQYVNLIGGLTEIQRMNAHKILQREGLLPEG